MNYAEFLTQKHQLDGNFGFEPTFIPKGAFEFQKSLIRWATLKGRAAIFADCGLGKTLMQLAWAENVARRTNRPVLIVTPLSVASQTVEEGEKFGIECSRSMDGKVTGKIVVTNYERLHHFNRRDFCAAACDESSILKNFKGKTKAIVTEFMRELEFRLLCTATASPNDYIELGTSSEALGHLGYIDMLKTFFKSDSNTFAQGGSSQKGSKRFNKNPFGGKFRFRGHAERDFWRWVCSWARAVRKPSDLGFSDEGFKLPELITVEHVVSSRSRNPEFLFDLPAHGLYEQRKERRRTITERCEMAAELVISNGGPSVSWCSLNDEGDMLERMIPGAVNVEGSDCDEKKEEMFNAFRSGEIKNLVTKPDIAGFGMNWQHCAHATFFPSHSYEQFYQSVRRCWRYGQKNAVRVDLISSEGESGVLKNLNRKSAAADQMFSNLVELMNNELNIVKHKHETRKVEVPTWIS